MCEVRGKVTKAEKNMLSGKRDTKPKNVKVRRFKKREPCNRCVDVIVSTDTPFITETRNKVIVGDVKGSSGSIT